MKVKCCEKLTASWADRKAVFTLSYMYGVHARRTCTPYMYDSVNTALKALRTTAIKLK